jgi:general secretion pathway protein F
MTEQNLQVKRYKVKVFSQTTGFGEIERSANNLAQLKEALDNESYLFVSAEVINSEVNSRKSTKFPLMIFCQQLLSLLQAGLQLVEAVNTLTEKELDPNHRWVLDQLQTNLRAGLSFSQALLMYPKIFPSIFQAAIEASEQTGAITDALDRFVSYETQFQKLKNRLIGAMIYPLLLLSMGGLVIAFLLGYVVPRFSVVFIDRLDSMPYLSALVIRFGLVISDNPIKSLLTLILVVSCASFIIIYPSTRASLIRFISKFRWLGDRIHAYELVRIYRSLSMLLRGGIPVVRSMQMIRTVASAASQSSLERAILSVSEGQPLSMSLQKVGLTTIVSERLLAVGERSGQMGEMMSRAADFLDTELEQSIDRAVKLLEPLMMVFIGGLIGAIVILMYLPIFELADSIQ